MLNDIPYSHPAWIEINLDTFKRNIANIRKFVHHKKICIPIKANGYGHGLIPIARAAVEAEVDYLAVSYLQEGILLRQAGINCPILLLGAVYANQIADLIHYDIEMTVASLTKAQLIAKAQASTSKKAKIHLEVDTGMQRTGTRIESTQVVLDFIKKQPSFELRGVYTHFATSESANNSFAQQQIKRFTTFVEQLKTEHPGAIYHMANSGGIIHYPESHLDMVRPGKLVFGSFEPNNPITQPIFSVKARISYFKVVASEQGISYGHTYQTRESTRVVTVPIGYGDGYRRALSNKADVLIHGKRYKVAGTICMDQFMVDIGQDEAFVGDEVVLVGRQGNEEITLGDLASHCNTITSEILCGFNDRLPHLYISQEEQFWEYRSLQHSTTKRYHLNYRS